MIFHSNIANNVRIFKKNVGDKFIGGFLCVIAAFFLFACDGSDEVEQSYSVSGQIIGLHPADQVTLLINGRNPVTLAADGSFIFSEEIPANGGYVITVGTQPAGKICTVSNGTGAGMVANVNNVQVTCSTTTYTVGGTVTGLASGQQVTLLNNSGDPIIRLADGEFTFPIPVAYNGGYTVTVGTQPTGQVCTVGHGTGAGMVANVNNVQVTCSTTIYTVGGTVTGLANGQQVTLRNNGGDSLVLSSRGPFKFDRKVVDQGNYVVLVDTQPVTQSCIVRNYSGIATSNIYNITVECGNDVIVGLPLAGYQSRNPFVLENYAQIGSWASAIAVDASGNVYVTNLNGNRIVKITPNGVSTTLAGSTNDAKGSADGTGTDATFYGPRGLAVDVNGNLYVADRENNKIRKITPDGVVSTLAGSGAEGSVDGTGTMAAFFHPSGIAVDTSGNVYVGDVNNEDSTLPFNKIRKITPDGVVYTLTGSGNSDPSDPNRSVDGNKTTAGIYYPAGLAVNNGIIFVAEADGQKIRKITSNGDVTTLAGSGTMDSIDGTGTGASFATPVAVAIHSRTGDLYVVDEEFSKLRRVTQSGVVTTLKIGLPNGIPLFFDPDPITNTTELAGVAFDPSSKYLYLTDASRDMVYKFEVK